MYSQMPKRMSTSTNIKKHNLLIDNLKHSNSHPRDDYTQRHKTNFFNNSHNAHKIGGSTGGTTCG